jgi:hypothetical protein
VDSNDIAAIAGFLSAIAAFTALCFSASQNSLAASSVSFSAVQKFSDECRDLWRRSRDCTDDPDKFDECVGEILGSFELFAMAVNEGALTPRSLDYIIETICDYLNSMSSDGYIDYVQPRTEKQHVCKELKQLAIQHAHRFENPQTVAKMLNISASSMP